MDVKITEETCCNCGILFWVGSDYHHRLVSQKTRFYCPNGHPQSYTGPSDHAKWQQALIDKAEAIRMKDREIAEIKKECARKKRKKMVIKKT